MANRREFIAGAGAASLGILTGLTNLNSQSGKINRAGSKAEPPLVISTWKHGIAANEAAWNILSKSGKAIDAVEAGVRIPESDPEVTSVGYGGLPDRDGNVTLDACIMDETGNCGSVAFIQNIKNPISVARLVMTETPHIMIVGKGALEFALNHGFKEENLLTEKAKKRWLKWKNVTNYKKPALKNNPVIPNINNHDTIGMLAIDSNGDISGACTTSGLAWKYHGRVGDSPIIGAGMYVDNEVGGACATGVGEAVIKTAGSFLITELMRQGRSPQEACEETIHRILRKQPDSKDFQVAFLAVNKDLEIGAYSIAKGFEYALYYKNKNSLNKSDYALK